MPAISDRLSRASSKSSGPPDLGSAGTPELFVYGTLMLDDVVRTLIDRVPESVQTSAPGWRVAHLPDLPYPGLVADPTAEAAGRVYSDLSEHELAVFDAFENPTYVIEPVNLRIGRRGLAYVWPDQALPGVWTLATLDDEATRAYLDRVATWRERRDVRQRNTLQGSTGETDRQSSNSKPD